MGPVFDLYAGIAGIELTEDRFDLGHGVTLQRTYAHLMAPFLMAFKRPQAPHKHHAGPSKAVDAGFFADIVAEINLPAALEVKFGPLNGIARIIVMLLRLGVHPAISSPAYANHPFSTMAERPESETWQHAAWVAERWPLAMQLMNQSAEFSLALEALDGSQYIQKSSLALVSLWAALEALFLDTKTELRFRVSAFIASYLEPSGKGRADLQRVVAKLYDQRSAAAHGKPHTKPDDVAQERQALLVGP